MDRETLIKVVQMIDNRLSQPDVNVDNINRQNDELLYQRTLGMIDSLLELKEHLQYGIEVDINQLENELSGDY
jgi:hypothetical protein